MRRHLYPINKVRSILTIMRHDASHDNGNDTTQVTPSYIYTITDAAKALGMSVRTVQRKLDKGEWESVMVAGKRCVKLSAHDLSRVVPPSATHDVSDMTGDVLDTATLNATAETGTAMEPANTAGGAILSVLSGLVSRVEALDGEAAKPRLTAQEAAAKIVLTLAEAQLLTSYSRDFLRQAITDGTLKAHQQGRGFKIRRADLDAFVEAL